MRIVRPAGSILRGRPPYARVPSDASRHTGPVEFLQAASTRCSTRDRRVAGRIMSVILNGMGSDGCAEEDIVARGSVIPR